MSIFLPFFSDVLVLLFIVLSRIAPSSGVVVTATIDDTKGDSNTGAQPVYSPVNSFSPNSDCTGCLVHADPAQAFDGTWHDSSQFNGGSAVSVTLSFTGTAIDVFCILANTVPGAVTTTDLSFTLDGSSYPPYSHTPDSTSDYIYGAGGQVFSADGLDQVAHQLVITTNNPSGSLFLFDYASYTFDDGTSPPQPPDTTTSQVLDVVTTTSTASQVITTGAQSITTTQISTIQPQAKTVSASAPSTRSGNTVVGPSLGNPSSTVLSTTTFNTPTLIYTLPSDPPISASPSPSSASSSTAQNITASAGSKYMSVLAGTLVPVFLIVLIGTSVVLWRRRRAARSAVHIHDHDRESGVLSDAPLFRSHLSFMTNSARSDDDFFPRALSDMVSTDSMGAGGDWPTRSPDPYANMHNATTQDLLMRERDDSTGAITPTLHPSSLSRSSTIPPSFDVPGSPPPQYDIQRRPLPTIPPK